MFETINSLPTSLSFLVFAICAGTIAFFGIKMTFVARDLAQLTGLGEAFMGAVLIGGATSLSGIIASSTAAWFGNAPLAVSNSLGGIASQTMFLVLGDMIYRRYNLEYAAASVENLMMSAQLMLLLSILYIGFLLPAHSIFGVHPASILLIVVYLYTVKMLVDSHENPMWLPRIDRRTLKHSKKVKHIFPKKKQLPDLFAQFFICAFFVGLAGWVISITGMVIVGKTGLSSGVVGGLLIAISTSLPELVVAITAVRIGSLTLAVGDIIGGNAFDTLFVAVSDIFYREGSIFAAVGTEEQLWLGTAMIMNAILLLGLIYRERKGIANIGLESFTIMLVYISAVVYMAL